MLRSWLKRLFGSGEADPEERARIASEMDRHRTDAIIATERARYGRRIADSPIERDLGTDPNRNR
jgi:hypothetical protein